MDGRHHSAADRDRLRIPLALQHGHREIRIHGEDPAGSGVDAYECRLDSSAPGAWTGCGSPKQYTRPADGSHSFEVRAVDHAGNADQSPASFTWSIDTTAPTTQIDAGPAALTNTASGAEFEFSGSDAGGSGVASFECRLDSEAAGAWGSCTSPKTLQPASPRAPQVRSAGDRPGRQRRPGAASSEWTVDTTPPAVGIDSGPAGLTNDPTPTFAFSSEPGASFECSIDTGTADFGPCSGATSDTPEDPLPDGPYTFRVRATDAAGNQASATRDFEVDATAPDTQITAKPAALANTATAKFEFSGEDPGGSGVASFECRLDSEAAAAWGTCTSAKEYTGLAEGPHKFEVRAIDQAGNADQDAASFEWTVDTVAPTTQLDSHPAALSASDEAEFAFSGSDPGGSGVASFQCRLDSSSPGAWGTCGPPKQYSGLGDGAHKFEVRAVDQAGNADQSPASFTWSIDTTAPTTQIDSGPAALSASATAKFEFSGSDSGGSGIASYECRRDSEDWTPCTSPRTYSAIAEGTHKFEVRAIDVAGNADPSPASFEWTVDTKAPQTALDSHPASLANTATAKFEFSGEDPAGSGVDSYECRLDSSAPGAWTGCGSPKQYTGLADGSHSFEVRAVDQAGNADQSPASFTWSIDTTAPTTQIDSGPAPLIAASGAELTFSGSDAGGSGVASLECRLDSEAAAAWGTCTSPKQYTGLAEGSHKFEVRAIDQAGNADQSPASHAWTVDTTPPGVGIDSGPAGLTNDPTPTFAFSSEPGASFECSIDTGTADFGPCSGATSDTPEDPLPDGPYTFRVRATDAAGNQASATRDFEVDTASPQAPVLSATEPVSPANDNNPKIIGSAPAGTTVRLYASADCSGSPIATVSAAELEAGVSVSVPDDATTSFSATATTAADNTSGCSEPLAYLEDSSAPDTQITAKPAALANTATAKFEFTGSDPGGSGVAGFECRLDSKAAAAWGTCTSAKQYTGLAEGSHKFEVRAIDQAGNADQSAASFEWTVDTGAPTTQLDSHPAALSASDEAEFAFSGSDPGGSGVAGFECRLDSTEAAAWSTCTSGKEYTELSEGTHKFEVRAIDVAGNADPSPASFEWTVDTKAPQTALDSHPASLANTATAKFEFSGEDPAGSGVDSYECRLDSSAPGAWTGCGSPKQYTGLADGSHSFEVRAVDQAGNADQSPASFTWSIDTTAPTTQIDSGPAPLIAASGAELTFSGSDAGGSGVASLECRLDSEAAAAWASCTSPKTYSSLSDGAHKFEVRAIDQAGNADQSPASHAWTVDTTPPAVGIDSGPAGLTNDPTPTFAFSSEPGASFECSIDTGTADFGPCSGATSDTPEDPLPDGPYTFRVRATDAAGNQASATRDFEVDTASPQAPVLSATEPVSPANDNNPKIIGSAPAGTTVRLYASADCSGSPIATVSAAELEAGVSVSVPDDATTSFSATATTAADNTSGCSEPLAYLEDSSAPDTQITANPAALANSADASFAFSGSDPGGSGVASFECRLDSAAPGAWTSCNSPKQYSSLSEGSHKFEVRAIDQAGNADQSAASFSWQIDTNAPDPPELTATMPASPANDNSPKILGSAPAGTTVKLYKSSDCSGSPVATASAAELQAGIEVSVPANSSTPFSATATSAADNTSGCSASLVYVEDSSAPQTQITAHPAATADSAGASFAFTGADSGGSGVASYQCRLDSTDPKAWALCVSPKAYAGLADGAHVFEVRAIDRAGNADPSPASFAWTVDTTPPEQAAQPPTQTQTQTESSSAPPQAPEEPVSPASAQLVRVMHNAKDGTAVLVLQVPGPGLLEAHAPKEVSLPRAKGSKGRTAEDIRRKKLRQRRIKPKSIHIARAGQVKVPIALTAVGKRLLDKSHRLKVKVVVRFRSAHGASATWKITVTLKKNSAPANRERRSKKNGR